MTFVKVNKLALFCFFSSVANAQTVPDAGSVRQLIERHRVTTLPSAVVPERPIKPDPITSSEDGAIAVKAFRFSGNTLFSADQLTAEVGTFLDRSLKFSDLQEAAATIARFYRKAGWVVRILLPDQDIQDGVVTIQIVEAIFGGVESEGETPSRIKLERLIGIVNAHQPSGVLLNAKAIDRALLVAGDLPGVTVTGGLRQGLQRDQTDLVIAAADKPLLLGDAAVDNSGSRGIGSHRVSVNLGFASALGLGDQINLISSHTEGSNYLRIGATFPLGYAGWRVGANRSHLAYKIVSPEMLALKVEGTSGSTGIEATYPLIRTRFDNLFFAANYDSKTFNNLANGAVTTRYKTSTFTAQLNGNQFDSGGGGVNNASLLLMWGDINLNGSPNQSADAATTQTAGSFTKLRYALSRQQAVSAQLTFFASLSGQYTRNNLDSSEKFSLGGPSGVRAFSTGEGSGSKGQLMNFELRRRLPQGFDLTGFFDYGRLRVNRNNGFAGSPALNRFSLQGAGVTLAMTSANGVTLKATLARRTRHNPNPTDAGKDQDGSLVKNRIWLAANLPF